MNVLVVDDSAVVRQVISQLLSSEADMRVYAACDPINAMEKMSYMKPDVIVLDIEMPRMDGLTFLRKIMKERPTPVVMCSGVAMHGTSNAIRALEEGAVDVMTKPQVGLKEYLEETAVILKNKVRAAAQSKLAQRSAPSPTPSRELLRTTTLRKIIAIGASTGGTEAITAIVKSLPPDAPATVAVQHMPEGFTAAFADRLRTLTKLKVKEAQTGDVLSPGHVFIAPGNKHTRVRRMGSLLVAEVADGPLVHHHRPSVNVLFSSVAESVGSEAAGVVLTGMGDDGSEGLLQMRSAGALTIAQDEASSAVFGMPREAIARGAAMRVLPLHAIPAAVLS